MYKDIVSALLKALWVFLCIYIFLKCSVPVLKHSEWWTAESDAGTRVYLFVGPQLWFRIKYLNNHLMVCHEVQNPQRMSPGFGDRLTFPLFLQAGFWLLVKYSVLVLQETPMKCLLGNNWSNYHDILHFWPLKMNCNKLSKCALVQAGHGYQAQLIFPAKSTDLIAIPH